MGVDIEEGLILRFQYLIDKCHTLEKEQQKEKEEGIGKENKEDSTRNILAL